MTTPTYRKKLIEVALPLEAINRESAREKSIRHGHPSTLHLWWARRPLAACRAVLFASLVDDPSSRPEEFPTVEAQDRERQRLFRLLEMLVKWENSTNETVLNAARVEILRSTDGNPPPVLDPFCGGGSIPLEAQRLGLEAHGSDLNPVPVLITKALIEIPPKFAGQPPVNPGAQRSLAHAGLWKGAAGLAEDVRYYGRWMRDEAERRIGHLYPKVRLPSQYGGSEATVIAWIWARTMICPNPACGARMPLIRSFALATKKTREASLEAIVDRTQQPPNIRFEVRTGPANVRKGTVGRRGATCIACESPVPLKDIRAAGRDGLLGTQLIAVVAEGDRQRIYVSAPADHQELAEQVSGGWFPEGEISHWPGRTNVVEYGMTRWGDLFTPRQRVLLTTLCDLAAEALTRVRADADAMLTPDNAEEYARSIATYLSMCVSRSANYSSNLCIWSSHPKDELAKQVFLRRGFAMSWDYAETNPFSSAGGTFDTSVAWLTRSIPSVPNAVPGDVRQQDARDTAGPRRCISTDPPYYDNISYAVLADFFYIWLRRSLQALEPRLFSTLLTPKAEELIASPYSFGGDSSRAQSYFQDGFEQTFKALRQVQDPEYPLTAFYAFKQAEDDVDEGDAQGAQIASTGWETFLEGLLTAGFTVDGTWPMRTELVGNLKKDMSALASSIVLVCRPRPTGAPNATRRQFLTELQRELPTALRNLQHGNIAPVDLAQAAIGPGMAVFSRHSRVLESDGSPMRVRTALALINQVLAETLAEQEGEMDGDTRWALTWFDQYGFAEGPFGDANTLANAKNTSTDGLVEAGVVLSARGKVRLLKRDELRSDWDPVMDTRRTVWEATHYLIRALEEEGEQSAAVLLAQIGEDAEHARDLAYRLYTTCERRGWTQDAQAYNSLVVAWPELTGLASSVTVTGTPGSPQPTLGF